MRIFYCLCLLLFMPSVARAQSLPLLPYPNKVQITTGHFVFSDRLNVQLPPQHPHLQSAVARFIQQNQLHTKADFSAQDSAQLVLQLDSAKTVASIQTNDARRQEQYQIQVSPRQILLRASHTNGLLRALQTLQQLVERHQSQIRIPALQITDGPRFSWRGLLLDPARRFLPVVVLKRQLDLMAAVKLNVLHLHLTDDQGWRFESKRFPKLHQVGGKDGYYTQDELKELVSYAQARGIRIVPEIDVPGHTTALGLAYPELMTAPAPIALERHWGVHPAVLDPSNEQVYSFLQQLFAEVAAVFPDPYFHIGGDEVLPDRWQQSPRIQAFMRQHQLVDIGAIQAYFNRRVEAILQQLGKTMIGWDELLDGELPASVVVQSWRGTESLFHAAEKGHPALLSTGFYLDQPQTAAYHYRNDPIPSAVSVASATDIQHWSGWNFQFERKRGSPVTGALYLLQQTSGQNRLFIQFPGKMLIEAQILKADEHHTEARFDSWMGPVVAQMQLTNKVQGKFIVGNAAYPLAGQVFATKQRAALPVQFGNPLSAEAQQRILGGEIALWGELITPDLIDIRLWPNGFAVAERLWSSRDRTDEQDLYQRLRQLQFFARKFIGLNDKHQQLEGFRQLVPAALQQDLIRVAELLEPAHYYNRLHEKSVAGLYHQHAPLDQLVDFLPAEHPSMRQFEHQVALWLSQKKPAQFRQLQADLRLWLASAQRLSNAPQIAASPIFEQIADLCQSGLLLTDSIEAQHALSQTKRLQIQQQLEKAGSIQQEMIIALHRAITALLKASD